MVEIRLEEVTKKYKQGNRERIVLKNINITFPAGKFITISGDSGVGKSTLLNIIAGLIKPSDGKIFLGEREVTGLKDKELSDIRNKYLGIVTQNCDLLPYLTLIENLKLAYIINKNIRVGEMANKDLFSELLNELGLLPLQNALPTNLSSGEIKRAAIARALITKPEIIILDEPTANLDRQNVNIILKILRKYCDLGSMVIISSHERDAFAYSDIQQKLEFVV